MYVCIDSSARRPNHTLYIDETTSLSTLRWEMSAPIMIFERRSKIVFCLRHPQMRPNFCRQARWLIFRLSRLSAKIGPDASTPQAKLQLLATIRQLAPRRVRERSEKCFKRLLSRLMSETGPRLKKSVRSV